MGDLLLPHLMVGNCNDRICVRVSRLWDFYHPHDAKKLLHTNMVLVDEEGNSTHAQLYPTASDPTNDKFKQSVEEGGVYTFFYFRVKNSGDNYKPVANDLMLSFSKWTKIEKVVDVPPAFLMYTYSLASMDQLRARMGSRVLCSDVIGVTTTISNVVATQTVMGSESAKRTVTICVPSGALLNVVLWEERATSFPAEQIHRDGQSSPQVVIFVGTFVKSYGGLSLSGGSSCKWYINPDVPEAKKLMASARPVHKPITWDKAVERSIQKDAAVEKKISDIVNLNPFECKKSEFLITVTIKKVNDSWWYNACKKCMKTAKRHGDSYKCTNPKCATVGVPSQRYKLSIVAGDETGDAEFILFGRQAQRLTKKTADTLVVDNPVGFIPDEITGLLENTYIWSVSFTDSTTDSGNVTFQVNAVVGEINDGGAVIPKTPEGSQASSFMLSGGAGTTMQDTPQKSHDFALSSQRAASETSLASSATPNKESICATEPLGTPQSEKSLPSAAAVPVDSSTKTRKSYAKKRSRPSPEKRISKKLFTDEEAGDDNDTGGSGVDAADHTSPS
ncbi:unnamed protein product [Urochloa humidicola]